MDSKISKKEIEIFRDSEVFPSAGHLLQIEAQPIEKVLNHCLVVIDTNVLLLPFTIDQKDLRSIEDLYGRLRDERRIFVPAQVAREFVKNRASKLSELINNLNDLKSRIHSPQIGKYPLLQDMDEYQHVLDAEKNIKESTKVLQDAISQLTEKIKLWSWNDPVSVIYSRIFSEDQIVELSLARDKSIADLEKRSNLKIPPGFKDSKKADGGIGDILIWQTILQLGKDYQKPLIFITGEEKADWWHKSGGQPLYPRFELVEEYWRASKGQSFNIVPLSKMLEVYGQDKSVVDSIRQSEVRQNVAKNRNEQMVNLSEDVLLLNIASSLDLKSTKNRYIPSETFIDFAFGVTTNQITQVVGFDLKLKTNLGTFSDYFEVVGVNLSENLTSLFCLGFSIDSIQIGAVPSQDLGERFSDTFLGIVTIKPKKGIGNFSYNKKVTISFDIESSIVADVNGKSYHFKGSDEVDLL